MGFLLLGSEWQPDKRPRETKISSEVYASSVGEYELSPSFTLGMFAWRMLLLHVSKAVIYIPAGLCLALVLILLRRARTVRKRWMIAGSSALVTGLLVTLVILASSYVVCAVCHPTMGIRREGERLFVQYDLRLAPVTGKFITPADAKKLPRLTGELLAESETVLFERTTGIPMTFSRGDQGRMARVTANFLGTTFEYRKISNEPPKPYLAPKSRVAIKLNQKFLDECVGDFEFPPSKAFPTGIKATLRREGEQLLWQARGQNVIPGSFKVYAESETNFFIKVHAGELTLIKNDKGEVTAVSLQNDAWLPDGVGKKLPH